MPRSRMKLNLIENRVRRRACYKKRKGGLVKKIQELTTLCGVEACMIMFSHFDSDPQTWPPSHSDVMEIINKFKSLSLVQQNRKTITQESFIINRIKKLLEHCKKIRDNNRQNEIALFVSETVFGVTIDSFSLPDLRAMRRPIYLIMDTVSRQIEEIKEKDSPYPNLSLMLPNRETAAFLAEDNQNNQAAVVAQEKVADVDDTQNSSTRDIRNVTDRSPGTNTANSYYQAAVVAPETNNFQNPTTVQNELMGFGADYGYRPMMAQEEPPWNMNTNNVVQNPFFNNLVSSFGQNQVAQPGASRVREQSPAGSNTTDWISILLRDMQDSAGNSGFFGPL